MDDAASQTKDAQQLASVVRKAAQRTDEPVLTIGDTDYAIGMATTSTGGTIVIGLPLSS